MLKITAGALGVLLLLLAAAFTVTRLQHRREFDSISDEQKLAHTLQIIRTSTPTDHKVLKVLFYGQSITFSGWNKQVVEHWHQAYPNTTFVVQNRAIGGFSAEQLIRTTPQDITAFYPDLIVFHVYGDHHYYEQILRLFRSTTAADIIVQTDHGEVLPDPPCQEGLQLSLHHQPGCVGTLWVHQRLWEDEMSYHKIPAFGRKYGLAVEPQRLWWRDYLLRTHTQPRALLMDVIHPNAEGKTLLANFFDQFFDHLVDHWSGQTGTRIVDLPDTALQQAGAPHPVTFDGTRLELITSTPLSQPPTVLVDGTAPKDLDGCYLASRPSPIVTVPDWPAIHRVTLLHDHLPEQWTATIDTISPDQKTFTFHVRSSVTGDQGSGTSDKDFTSRSGTLLIESQDWMPSRAFQKSQAPLPVPFDVHWSVTYTCGDNPETIELGNGLFQLRYVLANGLSNREHTVSLAFPPPPAPQKTQLRAYKPPLLP
jgi:hypothetical protein